MFNREMTITHGKVLQCSGTVGGAGHLQVGNGHPFQEVYGQFIVGGEECDSYAEATGFSSTPMPTYLTPKSMDVSGKYSLLEFNQLTFWGQYSPAYPASNMEDYTPYRIFGGQLKINTREVQLYCNDLVIEPGSKATMNYNNLKPITYSCARGANVIVNEDGEMHMDHSVFEGGRIFVNSGGKLSMDNSVFKGERIDNYGEVQASSSTFEGERLSNHGQLQATSSTLHVERIDNHGTLQAVSSTFVGELSNYKSLMINEAVQLSGKFKNVGDADIRVALVTGLSLPVLNMGSLNIETAQGIDLGEWTNFGKVTLLAKESQHINFRSAVINYGQVRLSATGPQIWFHGPVENHEGSFNVDSGEVLFVGERLASTKGTFVTAKGASTLLMLKNPSYTPLYCEQPGCGWYCHGDSDASEVPQKATRNTLFGKIWQFAKNAPEETEAQSSPSTAPLHVAGTYFTGEGRVIVSTKMFLTDSAVIDVDTFYFAVDHQLKAIDGSGDLYVTPKSTLVLGVNATVSGSVSLVVHGTVDVEEGFTVSFDPTVQMVRCSGSLYQPRGNVGSVAASIFTQEKCLKSKLSGVEKFIA